MINFNSYELSFLKQDWLWNSVFSSYRQRKIDVIADLLTEALHKEPRYEMDQAQNNKLVLEARSFLRNLTVKGPHITALKTQLLAAKLGVTKTILDANPGFEDFAARNHLERYFLEYKDKIEVRQDDEIFLRMERGGESVTESWRNVQALFDQVKGSSCSPSQSWVYGPLGLQKKDMYEWQELFPYKKENPVLWDKKYIFEVCLFLTGSPRSLTGNHSWLRLRTPEGDVYSVGKYRTGKRGANQHLKRPLRVMQGELMSPDVSEFWPGEVKSLKIEITQDAFKKIKKDIEDEKAKGTQPFEDFDENCTRWVVEKAKIAGISLHARESLVTLFLPRKVERIAKEIWKYIPLKRYLEPVLRIATAFFVNSIQLALGAGHVDAFFEGKVVPRISSVREIINPKKLVVYHPYTVADKAMVEINTWRSLEIERVRRENRDDKEQEISRIAFSLPPR